RPTHRKHGEQALDGEDPDGHQQGDPDDQQCRIDHRLHDLPQKLRSIRTLVDTPSKAWAPETTPAVASIFQLPWVQPSLPFRSQLGPTLVALTVRPFCWSGVRSKLRPPDVPAPTRRP